MMPSASKIAVAGTIILLAALLPYGLIAIDQEYLIGLASRIVIYGLAALSLNFILGYGGMVSFGHAAYFGVGAYVVGILSFHAFEGSTLFGVPGSDSALFVWPLAILLSAFAALVLGYLSLRTSGVYFIMITLAFAQMLYFMFVSLERYGGDDGVIMYNGRNQIPGLDLSDEVTLYLVSLVVLVIFMGLFAMLVRSRFGMVLRACKQNEARMLALGCNVQRYKLTAFVIAGSVAGLAGVLNANLTEFVSPDYVHWTKSGDLMIMVVLGGMGTIPGPVIGSGVFLALEEFLPGLFELIGLAAYKEHWRIVFGPLLILVVLFARGGILGLMTKGKSDA
ncbi:MAG: branched-chain amino acid ABC transporter permease [Pseudomonadota bacterium]